LPQAEFEAAKFDSGRFNLHQQVNRDGPPPTLVVLVHGLGGSGYETWGQLPQRLFSGAEGPAVDVGIYDYRSLLRGIFRRTGKFEFWLHQLAGHLRQVATEYSDIVLVGHSLGGLLVEAVAKDYLETRALQHQEGAGSLVALVVVASPRAGSGWALRMFQPLLPELHFLRRLGSHSAEVDKFFATHVERHNVTAARPPLVVLPVYAALGGGDKLVSQFSAAFGVPTPQRLYLDAGHISIVKPEQTDAQLIGWLLHTVIAGRLGVRTQAAREQQFAAQRPAAAVADPRHTVVTRFLSDSSGLPWEELYNDARRDATTTTVAVQDVRDVPGMHVDLLVAIHDAALVVVPDSVVRATVLQARAEQAQHPWMSVGICPVGVDFKGAETTVQQWLADLPPAESFYIKGAADTTGLRGILTRLLQLVIGRNPRLALRTALADRKLGEPNDMYDDPGRGGF
jgi:pimeloyl-ACP methyl ester carboxylesterase